MFVGFDRTSIAKGCSRPHKARSVIHKHEICVGTGRDTILQNVFHGLNARLLRQKLEKSPLNWGPPSLRMDEGQASKLNHIERQRVTLSEVVYCSSWYKGKPLQ